jgi:predicted nuclease of restriction endonuclease-like RecB superfamily
VTYRLRSGDPLPPARELAAFDSRLEARFARDFEGLGSDFTLVREPEPVPLGGGRLLFPDFALVSRRAPERRWLLEIVGFWTAAYLEEKLARFREARLERVLLCVDERRACREEALPAGAKLVRFRSRISAPEVLSRIEERDDRVHGA